MKKRTLQITVSIILLLCACLGMYKIVKWDEKNAIERQKLEEQKNKEEQEKAERKVLKYVEKYTNKQQNRMQKEGISDLRVRYTRCTKKDYEKHYSLEDYEYEDEDIDYFFFYTIEYYSDSIDSVYADKTKNGDFNPFITLMDHTSFEGDLDEVSCGKRHEMEWKDKTVAIYIASENYYGDITIKKEPDQSYRYEEYGDTVRIYVNGEKVYEGDKLRYDGTPYSEQPSQNTENNSGSSTWGNSNSHSGEKSDPYDVYDYDDPDEFADEWGEEFGDGSYEDGYDEAYDYWEEEMD